MADLSRPDISMDKVYSEDFEANLPVDKFIRLHLSQENGGLIFQTIVTEQGDGFFIIRGSNKIELNSSSIVEVSFAAKKSFYWFATRVKGIKQGLEGVPPLIKLERPLAWQTFELVPEFRTGLSVPVQVAMDDQSGDSHAGRSLDISLGGMLVGMETPLQEDEKAFLVFDLPLTKKKVYHLRVKSVVRAVPEDIESIYPYVAKFAFQSDSDDQLEGRLTQFLWTRRRERFF